MHALQKQIGIAVVLFQRAIAQVYLMRHKSAIDALNHPIVVNIRAFIESALRGKDHQIIEQHSPGGSRAHSSTLWRALALVFAFPASTRDTVLTDSPVRAAISLTFSFLSIL